MVPTVWKILEPLILISALFFNAFLLDADLKSLLLAIGGSISGSLILVYYRRELSKLELLMKALCSAIGGLVLGTALQTYLVIEHPSYVLCLFFTCSMLSLIVLRSILNFTEQNALEGIRIILQKLVGFKVESDKRISITEEEIVKQGKQIDKLEDKEK